VDVHACNRAATGRAVVFVGESERLVRFGSSGLRRGVVLLS